MFALHSAQRKPSRDKQRIFRNGFALVKMFKDTMLRCTKNSKQCVSEIDCAQGKLLD